MREVSEHKHTIANFSQQPKKESFVRYGCMKNLCEKAEKKVTIRSITYFIEHNAKTKSM